MYNAKLGLNRWKDVFNDRKIKMTKLGYSVNEYVTPKLQLETQFELQGKNKVNKSLLSDYNETIEIKEPNSFEEYFFELQGMIKQYSALL